MGKRLDTEFEWMYRFILVLFLFILFIRPNAAAQWEPGLSAILWSRLLNSDLIVGAALLAP